MCRVVSVALPGHPTRIGRDGRYRSVHPTVRGAATTGMFARCRFGGHRHDLKP